MHVIIFGIISLLLSIAAFNQTPALQPFPLTSVRLLNSPFKEAQETDMKYMLSIDVERLLVPFLREAGIQSNAISYGNWENTGLDGHIGGHYLSALSNMYASTGDARILARLKDMIARLDQCQKKDGNGYVGGIPGGKAMWQQVALGKIDASTFGLNKRWVPLYNIHKLFAGLIDAYAIAGNQQAKEVLIKLSDWFAGIMADLSDDQIQNMLTSEHGGMNEVFADVASITGDNKYLQLARRLTHRKIINPLLQQKDELTGLHANTQIPKVIGMMRVGELGGDLAWTDAARFFWKTVTGNRTISIGGNSVREHFNPSHDFSSMLESREGPETCNSFNMLRLTKQLFLWKPAATYMDYYERTLYNHILSSQHPDGGFVYFTPIRPRHYRVYSQPQQSFWCCVGTGLENHGKYGELIYAHRGDDVFVNLFIPSVLQWKEKGIVLEQKTRFPYTEQTQLTIKLKSPKQFTMLIRRPSWVKGELKAKVNNKAVTLTRDNTDYASIKRVWKSGDMITIYLPMETKAEFLPDSSQWMSFVRGPIVLAAATDSNGLTGVKADDSRMGHIASGPLYPIEEAPMIVSPDRNFASQVQPVINKPFAYTASTLIYPQTSRQLQLVPFYTLHDTRYMLYWRYTTPLQLDSIKEAMQKNQQAKLELEKRTIDQVVPGEQQPESDHNFKGEKTENGVAEDRHWRHAKGWFSYDLKNTNLEGKTIRVTYNGMDKNRDFDILINNIILQSVQLKGTAGKRFVDIDYPLTEEMRKEKLLTIKFIAQENSIAGAVYDIRLLK